MKFELDPRTGHMMPKKDDTIYFSGSMGGGLIIDDKKNNKRYIIERDGHITVLFGNMSKDNLHFYDMRDARDIEMRVKRKFGPSHPYANYKKFLKGVRESYIKTFDEFTDNE
jgi:hypothetical protein